ncbi:MAG: response regulator [Polyangiaceae bacterium]
MNASSSGPIRVFVVEDDELIRESLLTLMEDAGFSVVGSTASASSALEALRDAVVDVAIVDLGLGSESGIDLIREVSRLRPDVAYMVHTVFDDRDVVFRALKAGASSYLLKGSTADELCAAVRELHAGGSPINPRIARLVIQELHGETGADAITPRERQILRAIDAGQTYKEVAACLGISVHTVHSHIKTIYERLQAHGKRQALAEARRRGLI